MSRRRVIVITAGVMLSLFMAAVESTVVSTAMPTIVSQLGGLATYSWVFSAYMLASTTTVPLYGKLSDLYGRKPLFLFAMGLFLLGSVLSGQSHTMGQLIGFRALQGLGAGGLQPLAFIIIGEMFSFEQRARMQGLFSGVWGVASIVGPLLGGFLVDNISWHWVFYVNLLPGFLAAVMVGFGWRDAPRDRSAARPTVDYAGAALMSAAVVALLLGLFQLGKPIAWELLGLALLLLVVLVWVERHAPDPVLPMLLFRRRLFAVGMVHGLLAGWAMFGSTSFVPLFVQAVLGTSATAAGSTLTPQMLGWVLASIIGARLLLRFGYRTVALVGMVLLTIGSFLMTRVSTNSTLPGVMASLALMGIGMGFSMPSFLIAVQSSVQRKAMGAATATLQFSRSIGGTLGVSVMGVILSMRLAANMAASGLSDASFSLDSLIHPAAGSAVPALDGALRGILAGAIRDVFLAALVAAALGLVVTTYAPRERVQARSASPAAPAPPRAAGPVDPDPERRPS